MYAQYNELTDDVFQIIKLILMQSPGLSLKSAFTRPSQGANAEWFQINRLGRRATVLSNSKYSLTVLTKTKGRVQFQGVRKYVVQTVITEPEHIKYIESKQDWVMRKLIQHTGSLCPNGHLRSAEELTASQFSKNGSFLAVGNNSGGVTAFSSKPQGLIKYSCEVRAQSKDYKLENCAENESTIRSVEWMDTHGSKTGLLTVSSLSIKLWKLTEKAQRTVQRTLSPIPILLDQVQPQYSMTLTKELPRLHASSIKGGQISASEDYVLSFDATRVLKWNLQKSSTPFELFQARNGEGHIWKQETTIDENSAKQAQDYEENEWGAVDLLTCAKFHGGSDNRVAFSTKNGEIFYTDMRLSNRSKPSIVLRVDTPTNFLWRYLNIVSDFAFLPDDFTVVSRDFLSTKVWDLRNPKSFTNNYSVYPSISTKIYELYQHDRLEEQFRICLGSAARKIVTNNFDSSFHEIDLGTGQNTRYKVNSDGSYSHEQVKGVSPLSEFNIHSKTQSICYNPLTDAVCSTVRKSLFVFSGEQPIDTY